ncbi:MAG: ABC transporter substrate-binding protein [Psychrilyobacter sp.]|uniref:ABC transporter substrate-binding protein n=1 Tax=Psychrilyobacter sp. TaxID=2586924 RepID=UPI003C758FCD
MKKRKSGIFLILALMFVGLFVGCGKSEKKDEGPSIKPLNILAMSSNITLAQVVQSQLKKVGISSKITEKKDYSTYLDDLVNGSFDITAAGWTTVTGNPDYAVMSLFHTNGDYNRYGLADKELDMNLELGRTAKIGSSQFKEAYKNVEKIINEKAYIVPLYAGQRTLGTSKDLEGVILAKSRSFILEKLKWSKESGKSDETDPVYIRHTTVALTSLDPIKANDGTVFSINTNLYSRLVNLDPNDQIVSGLASSWYSNDQTNFYFSIQENAKFSNGATITPEDIKFSLDRAKDKNTLGNRVYTVQGSMKNIEILDRDLVDKDIIVELSKNGTAVSKKIIKIETKEAYGQLYNMLAHTSGGIVSKDAIEKFGDSYGDVNNINSLVSSGPYVLDALDKQKNEIRFVRNEYYYDKAIIKNIIYKVIPDASGSVLALQSGDVNYIYTIPEDSRESVDAGEKTNLIARASNGFTYLAFNNGVGGPRVTTNEDFRKAMYYAIDPQEILTIVLNGNGKIGASPLSPVVDGTGNETGYKRPSYNIEKAKKYLEKYKATLN